MHSPQWHDTRPSTTRQSPKQSGREGNSNLHFKHNFISILSRVAEWTTNSRCHCGVPSLSRQNSQLTVNLLQPPAIQCRTKNIGVRPRARPAQLHEEAIHADWMRSPSTRQAHKQMDVGHTHRSRIKPRHINQAPPMLQNLRRKNQSNKSQRHGIF